MQNISFMASFLTAGLFRTDFFLRNIRDLNKKKKKIDTFKKIFIFLFDKYF